MHYLSPAQLLSFIDFTVQYSVFLSVVVIQSIHSRFAFSPPYLFDGELFFKIRCPNRGGFLFLQPIIINLRAAVVTKAQPAVSRNLQTYQNSMARYISAGSSVQLITRTAMTPKFVSFAPILFLVICTLYGLYHEEASLINLLKNNNKNHILPTSAEVVKTRVLYTQSRGDRSGSVVHDMLYAHAYIFALNDTDRHTNTIYGGACFPPFRINSKTRKNRKLLKQIGLAKELPLVSCKDESNIMQASLYRNDQVFHNPRWLSSIHSTVQGNIQVREKIHEHVTAVHMRRGDVRPCTKGAEFYRYCPNQHYLEIMAKYVPKESHIQIYSETESYETFTDFAECCSMELDKDLGETWLEMMTADLLILSRSSFSYVPALLNVNPNVQVIYTPFWHAMLPNWTTVDSGILNNTEVESIRLRKEYKC